MPPDLLSDPVSASAFPRDMAEFLLELSIGVHRYAMYPPEHPSLRPAAATAFERLASVMVDRDEARFGVLRASFVFEGSESEVGHPVLSELASRLHDHEVAALTFRPGVEVGELRELLAALAPEVGRGGTALGALGRSGHLTWPHVHVEPLDYGGLGLDDEGAGDAEGRVVDLWTTLVRSSMGADVDPETPGTARRLVDAVTARAHDPLQIRLVAGYLSPLLDALGDVDHARLGGIRAGLSTFLRGLEPDTRERLFRGGGDAAWGREFLASATRSLDVEALLDLLDAAAEASGETISSSMTRLLTKLAAHGRDDDPAARRRADGAVRENIRALLRDWTLDDPNPSDYTHLLDTLSRRGAGETDGDRSVEALDLAERVFVMSLEIDQWTSRADEALRALLDAGRLAHLWEIIDEVPESSAHRAALERLRKPALVRRAVAAGHVDATALGRLAALGGAATIPPLMDGLVTGGDREVRRAIFDVLVEFGAALVPEITARLPSPYWYVNRNLLNLLSQIRAQVDVDSLEFLDHEDPRVRRAALPVALEAPGRAEAALARALSDRDERLVQQAVLRFRDNPSGPVVQALLSRVVLADRTPELRILAIRALHSTRSPMVRECLLEVVLRALRNPENAGPRDGAVAAAALLALRSGWPDAPDIRELTADAKRSPYASIRRAAGPS